MLPNYLIYVLDNVKSKENFWAGALILTFSHVSLLISVAEFETFTVSNMHESMSNTLRHRSQHCLMAGATKNLSIHSVVHL